MNLPPQLQTKFKSTVSLYVEQTIRAETSTDRAAWNAKIRRNELYYRGQQSLVYGANNGYVDYQPVSASSPMQLGFKNQYQDLYDYILNITQGDVDTFVAVLGSRAPNGQAQARDLCNEHSVALKQKADRVNAFLDSYWDTAALHRKLVRGNALYGTMFGYTRFVSDPAKFGNREIPQYDTQMAPQGEPYYACPRCGTDTPASQAQALVPQAQPPLPPGLVPCSRCGEPLSLADMVQPEAVPTLMVSSVFQFPNGSVECSIENASVVTVPTWVEDETKFPWLLREVELDKGAILRAYPELRPQAYDTSGTFLGSDMAGSQFTRNFLVSPAGRQILRNRSNWVYSLLWLTPATFEYLPGDQSGELRQFLLSNFPEGVRVPLVNGEALVGGELKGLTTPAPCRVVGEALTSVWAICKPKPAESAMADPYFECYIQMQDMVNDGLGMLYEQAERSNAFVIADPEVLGPDEVMAHASYPGEFKFAKPNSGQRLDQAFFRMQGADLNPTLITFIDKYISWCREITGIVPAIFGGDTGPKKTAREAEMRRAQALQKLNLPWSMMRSFWAKVRENAIRQAAKYGNGKAFGQSTPGTIETLDMPDMGQLLDGGWFMQSEESMPQTIGQRRDFVMSLLDKSPEVQSGLGMQDPDNVVKIQESLGLADWIVPNYRQVLKLHQVIGQLTQSQPIQPPPPMPEHDPVTGMQLPPPPPQPPQPSIPFDSFLYDPQVALSVLKQWLLGDKASQMENTPGYENVLAYAHSIMVPPPPPPPPQPPRMSVSADLGSLTPPAQHAIFAANGLDMQGVPPGMPLALPKPQPRPSIGGGDGPGAGDRGGSDGGGSGNGDIGGSDLSNLDSKPDGGNKLLAPPPGAAPLPNPVSRAPLGGLGGPG